MFLIHHLNVPYYGSFQKQRLRGSCLFGLLVGGIFLGLTGCKPKVAEESPPPEAKPVDPIRLGVFLPLTGAQSSFGKDAIRGAQLAVDEINAAGGILGGRPVALEVRDTRSDSETTKEAVEELAKDSGIALLVGEIASARSIEAAAIAQRLGVPMISPASTHQDVTALGDMIFRVCYAEPFQGAAMARFAGSIKASRAAIFLEEGNPYSQGLAASFRDHFVKGGGTIVAEKSFKAGDLSFSEQLEVIKAASPEVIFLPSYYLEAALVIQQARGLGMEIPFLGGDGWDSMEFLRIGGEAVENCYSANHFSAQNELPENAAFIAAYRAKFGEPPPPLAALAYDAVRLGVDAISRAASESRTAVQEALLTTTDFQGVTGPIRFGSNRNPDKPAVILRVEQGAFTYLETIQP
ncbi:MAG: ABC transporter substrate-binding protein [Terrimicrobiaceae bacterium]